MSKLIATRGLPASGKTTWAMEQVSNDPTGTINICRDDLRTMLSDGFVKENERAVMRARDALVDLYLGLGKNVIVSDTNFPNLTMRDLRKLAVKHGAEFEIKDFTDVSLERCIIRDFGREGMVGRQVIEDMYNRFLCGKELPLPYPEPEEGVGELEPYRVSGDREKVILVDLDGTLAQRGDRDPYDETRVHEDMPITPIVELVERLFDHGNGYWPIFVSARTDACFDATLNWLAEHVSFHQDEITLLMRKHGDMRKDWRVKSEIFDKHIRHNYDVHYVLDDRDQVVEMWRKMGLTCLQVADGKF